MLLVSQGLVTPANALVPETAVKAAFIYRFLEFVQWPPEAFVHPQAPIVIGVVGDDDIAAELHRIVAGRLAQGRPLQVVPLRDERDLAGVHVLFAGRVSEGRLAALLNAAIQRSILTVTDTPNGLDRGAVINLINVSDRVQFEISLHAAARAHLTLSSRLLSLAVRLKKGVLDVPPAIVSRTQRRG